MASGSRLFEPSGGVFVAIQSSQDQGVVVDTDTVRLHVLQKFVRFLMFGQQVVADANLNHHAFRRGFRRLNFVLASLRAEFDDLWAADGFTKELDLGVC